MAIARHTIAMPQLINADDNLSTAIAKLACASMGNASAIE
jgi:hypothetical protein